MNKTFETRLATIRSAIQKELANELTGPDERSPIELLVADVQAEPESSGAWADVVATLVDQLTRKEEKWWLPLELFIAVSEAKSQRLVAALERALSDPARTSPMGRASIYPLLDELGAPATAVQLANDSEYKKFDPLGWLELLVPKLWSIDDRRELILKAVEARVLTVAELDRHLDLLRFAGGTSLGSWLDTLCTAFPNKDRPTCEKILREFFAPSLDSLLDQWAIKAHPPRPKRTRRMPPNQYATLIDRQARPNARLEPVKRTILDIPAFQNSIRRTSRIARVDA